MPIKKLLNKFTYTPIEKIRGSHLPVLLYGMGNGAEKMYKICVENNIIPDGVFASDGFKSGKTFLGYTVVPASELKDLYPKGFIALVCFGCNSADMRMYIGRVKRLGGLVLMPHLPLFGGEFLDRQYFENKLPEIEKAYSLLSDPISKKIYEALCEYYLTWNPDVLFECDTNYGIFDHICEEYKVECAIDGGAYRGDTASMIAESFPDIKTIHAFEPDPTNFKKLCDVSIAGINLIPYNAGLWKEEESLQFDASHNRGAHFGEGESSIPVTTIDTSLNGSSAQLIKLDVEGCEEEAILGAVKTINKSLPILYVSLYHKTDDFFKLPLMVHRMHKDYVLHFMRLPVCPAWDIILVAEPVSH